MGKRYAVAAATMALAFIACVHKAQSAEKIAIFPFEIIVEDTLEGIPIAKPAEKKRLMLMTEEVVKLLSASGRYVITDNGSVAAEIDKQSPFFKCNGCEVDVAKKVDATLVLTGLVQKGSESAANISVAVRSVATGELVKTAGITVLENTDDGWIRGIRRLIKNRMIEEGSQK